MRVDGDSAELAERATLRRILEIVSPGNVVLVEEIENRAGNRFIAAWRRKAVAGGEMPERGSRHQIGPVGKSRPENGSKVAVVEREGRSQRVIKGNVILGVEAHSLVFSGAFDSVVELRGGVVDAHETILERVEEGVVGLEKVGLLMRPEPAVVQVRWGAALGVMEGENQVTVVLEVGVRAG